MPQERLPMRKIRDVLRLKAGGSSKRKIAASLGISPTAVGECVRRARRACLSWPLPASLDDETLESRLCPPPAITFENMRPQPDSPTIHRELKRLGVTPQLISEEHRAQHPLAMGTAGFATSTGLGRSAYPRSCGRRTWPASGCSSTMAERRWK
jgi:hypothetical protein